MVNIVVAQVFSLMGAFAVITASDPFVLVVLVAVMFVYYRLQRFYRKSSRELRRLDSVSKSPVYSAFSDCLGQAAELRAMGPEVTKHFEAKLRGAIDDSVQARQESPSMCQCVYVSKSSSSF
jgi:ABC-type multidrug transport system fused ATPase/permease subunit